MKKLPKGWTFEYDSCNGYSCLYSPDRRLIFKDIYAMATIETLLKYCEIFKDKSKKQQSITAAKDF